MFKPLDEKAGPTGNHGQDAAHRHRPVRTSRPGNPAVNPISRRSTNRRGQQGAGARMFHRHRPVKTSRPVNPAVNPAVSRQESDSWPRRVFVHPLLAREGSHRGGPMLHDENT